MEDGSDWLWRPVMRGKMMAESLDDPSIGLEVVADCNDALDVADENEWRLMEAAKVKR